MKPESIKSILVSYLKEKQNSSFDDVDGIAQGLMSGECLSGYEDRCSELLFMSPTVPTLQPYEDHYVAPLEPEQEEIAQRIGRHLSDMSDEYDSDIVEARENVSPALRSKSIHFKQHWMRVPKTCDNVQITVIRTGANGSASVSWKTVDKTAKAGIHYTRSEGKIYFDEGEVEKTINVLVNNNQKEVDISFCVELFDSEGTIIGKVNPLTVYIVDESILYDDEMQAIGSIFNCSSNISLPNVLCCIRDKVTNNTFKAALQCLCSNTDSIPKELAVASELLRYTLPYASFSLLSNVFCDYFKHLPELEDIASLFE